MRTRAFSVYYLYDGSDNPQGWGGNDRGGWAESMLEALDYQTGKVVADAGRRGQLWAALHGRQPDLHRRTRRRDRRAQRDDGRTAAARASATGVSNGPTTWELDGVASDRRRRRHAYAFAMRAIDVIGAIGR
jgi:alcohol dehydrogenase (cytochrome c)